MNDEQSILVLGDTVFDLAQAESFISYFTDGMGDNETILRTPEGAFIMQRTPTMEIKPPEYARVTVPEITAWLHGKADLVFADLETAIDELGLSRPTQAVKPVSDDTPPDDGGFDFGGDDNNQGSVLLETTA